MPKLIHILPDSLDLIAIIKNLKHEFSRAFHDLSFGDYIHRIYPKELEIKDITDTVKSASYLKLQFAIYGKKNY